MRIYKFNNDIEVGVTHGLRSWDGWMFRVKGEYSYDGVRQHGVIEMNRSEALALKRRLDLLLKATAPPARKKRS